MVLVGDGGSGGGFSGVIVRKNTLTKTGEKEEKAEEAWRKGGKKGKKLVMLVLLLLFLVVLVRVSVECLWCAFYWWC